MAKPDLNLLDTLDVVLATGSVTRAAQRLRLSPSAMSRALARLRAATGDPLLVRAGRGLVLTPHALALRERVGQVVQEVEAVLRPADHLDLTRLVRTFTLRVREGFVENFAAGIIAQIAKAAPGVQLCFVQKTDRDSTALREGVIDFDTGVVGRSTGPEVRARPLFTDRFIGVAPKGHALCRGTITPPRYAGARHLRVVRHGSEEGRIDTALEHLGLDRHIVATVDGFAAALALVRRCGAIVAVPERHTGSLRVGLHSFALPFAVPEVTVSLLWHPRQDADPAHRWLRTVVLESFGAE